MKINKHLLGSVSLIILVFISDLLTPNIFVSSILYALVVIGSIKIRPRSLIKLAIICSLLTIIGHFISLDPSTENSIFAIGNRLVSVGAIWVAVYSAVKRSGGDIALAESERNFKSLYETSLDMFASINPIDASILNCNQRLCYRLGYSKSDIIGKKVFFVYHPDCHKLVESAFNQFVSQGTVKNTKLELKTKSGEKVGVILNVNAVRDNNGRILYSASSWTDISEIILAEERLKQNNEDLRQANLELIRSNKELDEFAYAASHDLKSPLRAIDNLSKWILKDSGHLLPEKSRNDLETVRVRVARMNSLLSGLLEFSRIGQMNDKIESVDTTEVVKSAFELSLPPTGFSLEIEGSLPKFETVKVPFEKVMRNLLDNAIKHHDREDGKVTIRCNQDLEFYQFDIEDDGPGISEKYREQIFHMFKTLKPKGKGGGSGVGLALVKKTVENLKGEIDIDSAAPTGTIFRFTWPQVVEERSFNE